MRLQGLARVPLAALVGISLLGGFVAGCISLDAMNFVDHGIVFDQHDVVIGSAKSQTVLTGFLLGGATAELAVVYVDENDDRRLRIYAFGDGAWAAILDEPLRRGVLFVDVANIAGRDRLITYESGRVSWFDPDSATVRALVDIDANYNSTDNLEGTITQPGADIPRVDITRDLNHDGRDDLLVPDIDGFFISTQLSDGSFSDAVKFGPPEPFLDAIPGDDSRRYGDVGISALTIPWYQSRVYEIDYGQDGRIDLVFWNEDHFDVYHQNDSGMFGPAAETFTTDVPFDFDGAYSLQFGFSEESIFSLLLGVGEHATRTVLHSLGDLNADGVADLMTHSLEGRTGFDQRSRYEVHFGSPMPDGILFDQTVGTSVRPRGKLGAAQTSYYSSVALQDFDGDGQVDMMFREVNIGVGNIMSALLGGSVSMNLEFFRMESGSYPAQPNTTLRISSEFNFLGQGGPFVPAVLMGDVNGDGRADLVAGRSREELHVYVGVPGPELLAAQPQRVAVALPSDERNTWLVDLNKDGKQDILMHSPSTSGPHRVTILVAR